MKRRILHVLLCLLVASVGSGCFLFHKTSVPIGRIDYRGAEQADSRTLVVFLPGRSSDPDEFEKEGFIAAARDLYPSVDMVAVDAHFKYYYERTLLTRLLEDVVLPAKEAGYQRIWMVGVSMGGLGALLYAQAHPDTLDGILVLAPFLGDEEVIEEIEEDGGLRNWEPPENPDPDDYQRALWAWFKGYTDPSNALPALCIGYGTEDRMAYANRWLAKVLPPDRVFTRSGGHDWKTWTPLWNQFLEKGMLGTE